MSRQSQTLREAQRNQRNGERFVVRASNGREYECRWESVERGLFRLMSNDMLMAVNGAPDARVFTGAAAEDS